MNNPLLASRYAKSIIDLSIERNELEVVYNDMKLISGICKSNPDFVALLRSPVIASTTKLKIIKSVIGERVGKVTSGFIILLVNKSREANLPEIASAVLDQYNEIKNIHKLKVSTALPMTESLKEAILFKAKENFPDRTLELESVVDNSLIGGFIMESDGRLYDASVLRHLKEVKKHFMNNDYLQKLR